MNITPVDLPLPPSKMARKYNPKLIINERSGWEGDFQTNEGPHDVDGNIIPFRWEKNFSIAGSWAWQPTNEVMKFEHLMGLLINTFIRGGNALLNVTPDKDGVIPEDQVQLFRRVGQWMKENGESVYGTRGGPFQPVDNVYGSTYKENNVYIHILDNEAFKNETLPAIPQKIVSATTLAGEPVEFTQNEQGIKINVPESAKNDLDTIIKLVLDSEVKEILPAE